MTTNTQYRAYDMYNRLLRKGDAVVWPVRKGSSMWMNDGRVTGVNQDGSIQVMKADTGNITRIKNTHMTILGNRPIREAVNDSIRSLAA